MLRSLAGLDPRDSTCSARAVPDYERALTGDVKGLRIGVPKEYFVEGMAPEVEKSVREALANLRKVRGAHRRYLAPAHLVCGRSVLSRRDRRGVGEPVALRRHPLRVARARRQQYRAV
jgi:Asp-tRNA(Asn)/Glu-tRNA(Gln) amidotransferase A subunit family amidase